MSKTKLVGIVGVIIVLIAGVLVWKFVFTGKTVFTDNPNPLTVTPTLAESVTVAKSIDQTGGAIDLDITAAQVNLQLPANAVFDATDMSLTKIASLNGLPTGTELIAGVQAQPNGLQLNQASNLQFTLPENMTATKAVVGFGYSDDGQEFHYLPVKWNDTTATLSLTGFSGYGLIVIPDYVENTYTPSAQGAQATQKLAIITQNQLKDGGTIDAATTQQIIDILRNWYKAAVKKQTQAAAGDDALFEQAYHEYLSWRSVIQSYGYEDNLRSELSEADALLEKAFTFAVDQSSKRCREKKDITEAARLMWLAKFAQVHGIGDEKNALDKAFQCTNFELSITSTTDDFGSIASLSGTVPLTIDENTLKLTGTNTIPETNPKSGDNPCSSAVVNQTFTVEPTTFSVQTGTQPKIELPLKITDNGAATYDCSTSDYELLVHDSRFWLNGFFSAHRSEMTKIHSENSATFLLQDWEIVNSGGVFARKVYDRSVEGVAEQTTFELLHKPQ
ncbi:MAG: hypothetical protein A3F54_04210 [Candidatus Kerfeldbacteria bacterium RIFCSPHIGHO2_12_FULL_48_17]|uniref:Uncharacterized protein n=1 Tax=Candidatus Kerfeldbacteria bacterium RIFCSPHIGHO2_12_FULL_48_17 TaxID=1798542 RepID=A0A1G2B6X5_9BACT|nr:MAG: hypothetical protein A3F54_04210 [Candidatus Kerfeldbacteria bacterium RIFCSPHIGHO2_12_FULL_48_17]